MFVFPLSLQINADLEKHSLAVGVSTLKTSGSLLVLLENCVTFHGLICKGKSQLDCDSCQARRSASLIGQAPPVFLRHCSMRGLVPDREGRNGEEVVSREVLMKWADSFWEIKKQTHPCNKGLLFCKCTLL